MLDRRIITLTREIQELYARNCALADAYNAAVEREGRAAVEAFRARPSAIGELNHFEDVFDRGAAIRRAMADPRIRWRADLLQAAFWVAVLLVNFQCLARFGTLAGAVVLTLALACAGALLQHHLLPAASCSDGCCASSSLPGAWPSVWGAATTCAGRSSRGVRSVGCRARRALGQAGAVRPDGLDTANSTEAHRPCRWPAPEPLGPTKLN